MYFPISYAGFFAKSQIMFFSSIIIPILPAAQEWRHERIAFRCGIEWLFGEEEKNINRKLSPVTGSKRTTFRGAERRCKSEWDALPLAKVAALAVGRGKCEQMWKTVSCKTVLNTCLSFLNEVKNLGKGCKYYIFWPMYASSPLSPRKARHFPPSSRGSWH